MQSACLYHIADRSEWETTSSAHYAPKAYGADGFIHLSRWSQLSAVARRYYAERDDLLLLEIRAESIERSLVEEDSTGRGETYPHLYAELPRASVRSTLQISWASGVPLFARGGSTQVRPRSQTAGGEGREPEVVLTRARSTDLRDLALMNAMLREDEGFSPPASEDEPYSVADRIDRLAARLEGWIAEGQEVELIRVSGESEVAGYVIVDPRRSPVYVRQLFVQRGSRRRHIGRVAMHLIFDRYSEQEIDVAFMAENGRAARFWRSLGFESRSVLARRGPNADQPEPYRLGSPYDRPTPDRDLSLSSGTGDTSPRFQTIHGDIRRASAFITDGLKSFNDRESIYHRAAREPGVIEELAVMLTNDGVWVGGVCGSVAWGWLEVDDLWISDEFRHRGHGSELMRRLERLGAERGATSARLKTFSFQARPFYERLGYRVVGTMEDFPPGGAFYWMRKDGLSETIPPDQARGQR